MTRPDRRSHPRLATALALALSVALAVPALAAPPPDDQDRARSQARMEEQRDELRDQRLADLIDTRLARSRSLSGTDISVEVDGSVAKLSGRVGTEGEQIRAEHIARTTTGIRSVESDLAIDPVIVEDRRSIVVEDSSLALRVAEMLADEVFPAARVRDDWLFGWEVDGYNWEFDVEVDEGQVTLDGTVPEWRDIGRVVRATRAITGVRSVENELRVASYTADYPMVDYYYPHYYPFYAPLETKPERID